MMSHPSMSFGGSALVRAGWGGGWLHPKGANSMVASRLVCSNNLVGTERTISVLFGIHGVRKKEVSPCRASISSIEGPFFSYGRL